MKVISKTVFCLFPLLFPLSASAQITRDGTTSTTVTPTEAGVRIDDGNRAGGNLYHSFGEFSIPTGSEAFFNNASDIANIFSRVTGGNISNIDGLIRANGAANLFLINPAGIVFGEGASLQLGGSFYGSTADSIIFPDGEFSATDLENPPLITVNAPIGLGFRDNPGDIAINDDSTGQSFSFLAVNQGQNLALVGGNVSINRGFISAPGGRIELGGLASEGIITFDENGSLVFPEDVARGNVSLTQGTLIDVTSDGGGFIRVNANDLEIVDGSEIFAGIGEGLGTLESQAGDIEINARNISLFDGSQITSINSGLGNIGKITLNATENIVVDGGNSNSGVAQIVDPEATGDVGSINIQAQNLTLTDGGSIGNLVAGTADSGDINITVADTIVIDGFSELTTLPSQIISARANGDSGDISISTNNLFLSRSGVIINSILGQGNAGNINITAADSVTIDNTGIAENNEGSPRNGIFASVSASSIANGGDIEINTGNLFLTRGLISNSSAGDGDAGNITLNVANTFLADDSRINSNIGIGNREDAPALGKVGNIIINAENMAFSNTAQIQAGAFSGATVEQPGIISLTATESISFTGERTGIFGNNERGSLGDASDIRLSAPTITLNDNAGITADNAGNGQGGDIIIDTEQLTLHNSEILANISGEGNAGSVTVNSTDSVLLTEDSSIQALIQNNAIGEGGDITIDTATLTLSEASFITVELLENAIGEGGDITVDTATLTLSRGSLISAELEENATGEGGDITIDTTTLTISEGSLISAVTSGEGDAGDITVNASETVSLEGVWIDNVSGGISANVEQGGIGTAGDIELTTANLSISNGGNVSSSVFGDGDAGNITINARETVSIEGVGTNNRPSGVFTTVEQGGIGNAGELQLITANLSLTDGGAVSSSTSGQGDAGDIFINVSDSLTLADSGSITTSVEPEAIGDGGNITIGVFQQQENDLVLDETQFTSEITLADEGLISADSFGEGIGGSITVRGGNVDLNQGQISATTQATISLEERDNTSLSEIDLFVDENLTLRDNSNISARANNDANGGNINIGAEFIIAYPSGGDGNDITASAEQGQGGAISITAESLLGIEERRAFDNNGTNDIDASSGTDGLDGTVTIETPDNNPLRETPELTDNVVTAEVITTSDVCSASNIEDVSSLAVQGKGGIAPEPTAPFDGDALIVNGESETSDVPQNSSNNPKPHEIPPHIQPVAYKDNGEPIYIARGVMKQEDGTVILTAVPHQNISPRTPENPYSCGQ